MEHIDRQAIYFSLNLSAALTALVTEVSLMAWAAGITDGTAAAAGGRLLMLLLAATGISSLLWRMPRRPRCQLLMSAGELWSFTAMAALIIFFGFIAVCAGC